MLGDRSKATCRKLGIHCTWNRRLPVSRTAPDSVSRPERASEERGGEDSLGKPATTPGMRFDSFNISKPAPRLEISVLERACTDLQRRVQPARFRKEEVGEAGTLVPPGKKVFSPIRTAICPRDASCENYSAT